MRFNVLCILALNLISLRSRGACGLESLRLTRRELELNNNDARCEVNQQLKRLLTGIYVHLQAEEKVSTDDLIKTIEVTKMSEELFNQYYTKEQRQYLDERAQTIGEDKIQQVQKDWQDLFAAVEVEMNKGTEPTDEKVLVLAKRWTELFESFTGGNSGITHSLNNMVQGEYSTMQQQFDFPDARLFEYIGKAQAVINEQ